MDIKGHTVRHVLVEPAADIAGEIYLGVVVDRAQRRAVVMASREGGVEIEEVAATNPGAIVRVAVDPVLGIQDYQVRRLAYGIELPRELHRPFGALLRSLFYAFTGWDATLTEINPLVITGDGALMGLDAKMTLDDNALFRHPDAVEFRDDEDRTDAELAAREAGLSYVDLDGDIGCLVNGAGLAMATMDVIKLFGGEPANFLDIGGGAQADKVEAAVRIILHDPNVKAVLINIFGGITRGDEVARGLLAALDRIDTDVPMVARIVGTNAEEARRILADAHLETASTLAEAAQKAVRAAGSPGASA
jgi:succinyl-CoA synthetase beta subunit